MKGDLKCPFCGTEMRLSKHLIREVTLNGKKLRLQTNVCSGCGFIADFAPINQSGGAVKPPEAGITKQPKVENNMGTTSDANSSGKSTVEGREWSFF